MNPEASPKRPVRSWAAAFIALSALVAVAPASAEAGCRGHAVGAGIGGLSIAGLDELREWGALAAPADDAPELPLPAEPPPRCSGAFCSGSPAVPPAPSVAPVPTPEMWAILTERPDAHGPESHLPLVDEPSPIPPTLGDVIFHPPRSAAASL